MYVVDPQVAVGLEQVFGTQDVAPPPVGDWLTRRERTHGMFDDLWKIYPPPQDVDVRDIKIAAADGTHLTLRLYRKHNSDAQAVLLYLHGGGMIMCNLETHDGVCRDYASATGLPVVAVDYRLAPEHPFPTPVDDCYSALLWLADNATVLGLDAARIAVGGESAGGGLAAAVVLKARDEGGPALVGQMLIYPMLDDRTVKRDVALEPVALWTYDDHATAWTAYLGSDRAGSPYATPLRADDLSGLPASYVEVGELDIFRAESLAYASRLLAASVPVEFHLHPCVPHAFDLLAPDADVSRRAKGDRYRFLLRVASQDLTQPA